jgi:hypothetical protein
MDEKAVPTELLRGESPNWIIKELTRYRRITQEEASVRFTEANVDLKSFLPEGEKLFLDDGDQFLYVFFKYDKLIEELKAIQKYGQEHKVHFHWV